MLEHCYISGLNSCSSNCPDAGDSFVLGKPFSNIIQHIQKPVHRWPVVWRGATVLVPYDTRRVDHKIPAQLSKIAPAKVVPTSLGQQLDVGGHGCWAEHPGKFAGEQSVSAVCITLRVGEQREGQLHLP